MKKTNTTICEKALSNLRDSIGWTVSVHKHSARPRASAAERRFQSDRSHEPARLEGPDWTGEKTELDLLDLFKTSQKIAM